jgi:PAS domain S-box-containing protein
MVDDDRHIGEGAGMSGDPDNEPGAHGNEALDPATVGEDQFRLLVESVKDYAIFMLDPAGRITTWNSGAQKIKGYLSEEAVGKPMSIFYTPEDLATHKPQHLLDTAIAEGRVEDEGWRVRKDGTRFWADVIITALRAPAGQLVGFAKVTQDLTSRRRAEEELRRSESLLAATLHSIGDAVLATDELARITMINPVAEALTGWSREQAVGRHIDEVFHIINEETRAKADSPVARVLSEGLIVGLANHTALIARGGRERPIADSGAPIRDAAGVTRGAVLVFRDITEGRHAEDALRQSEEKLRLMITSIHDYAIYMLDPNGRVISWNPGAERIKGYREDEILGTDFARFFTPDDIAEGKPARELELAATEGRFEDETWRVRKDGTRFWANVVISAVRDASGRLAGFAKITRDLTERRAVEEERVRLAQVEEAVRVRDEFLSIASHELRTPLAALQLQLQSSLTRARSIDETLAARIERARKSSDRLADLIDRLLDVSRIATGTLTLSVESFDLVDAVREVVERVRDAASQAGCTLSFEAKGPIVGTWDRLRIEQILLNLLSNAIKYAAGTPIAVSASNGGDVAILEVKDGGAGLSESDLGRVFERFARVGTSRYGGLGLGLYITQQIAEAHGGTANARNLEGGGAAFIVRLPLEPNPSRTG